MDKLDLLDFLRFLDRSPTSWHGAREITNRLAEAGFTPLFEEEDWHLEPGGAYFTVREDSAIAAFRMPQNSVDHALVLATHLDSPALKLKPLPDVPGEIVQFSTEVYGAPLLYSWFDRDLYVAGHVCTENAHGETETHLISLDDYPIFIPSLAIHLHSDRAAAEKGALLDRQKHLMPVVSLEKVHLEELLRRHLAFQSILAFDLFLSPLEKAMFTGVRNEFISSARLDNLSSAYASLYAIATAAPRDQALQMAIFWDHEEIGSTSSTGARSSFITDMLERIIVPYGMDYESIHSLRRRSFCISSDVTHGFHPNFPEKFDPHNTPYLGKGIVIKAEAGHKYATSASTAAPLVRLCKQHCWPIQRFAPRADMPCGSTVGPIMAAETGIPTVDIGVACWAMHSIREVMAAQDQAALGELLKAALEEL